MLKRSAKVQVNALIAYLFIVYATGNILALLLVVLPLPLC